MKKKRHHTSTVQCTVVHHPMHCSPATQQCPISQTKHLWMLTMEIFLNLPSLKKKCDNYIANTILLQMYTL